MRFLDAKEFRQALHDLGVGIADVADRLGVALRRGRFLCPVHDEKRPAASLHRKTNTWRCFACGAYGDEIGLVRAVTGFSMQEAKATLHRWFGVGEADGPPPKPKPKRTWDEFDHILGSFINSFIPCCDVLRDLALLFALQTDEMRSDGPTKACKDAFRLALKYRKDIVNHQKPPRLCASIDRWGDDGLDAKAAAFFAGVDAKGFAAQQIEVYRSDGPMPGLKSSPRRRKERSGA